MIFVLLASIALNIILIGAFYYVLSYAGDPGLEIIVRAQEIRIAELEERLYDFEGGANTHTDSDN